MTNREQDPGQAMADYEPARAGRMDWLSNWWREATGPISWDYHLTPTRAILRRIFLWIPVVVLFASITGGTAFYFFTGWRARDLAAKAEASAKSGNFNAARVQMLSAENLRKNDPAVKRASALVRSKFSDPEAPGLWEELAASGNISPEDAQEWARVALDTGNQTSFAAALGWIEKQGDATLAAALRAKQARRVGNLGQSIREARIAAESGRPEDRLALIRVLVDRYAPSLTTDSPPPASRDAAREIAENVAALQGTPQANEALAITLGTIPFDHNQARKWADAVLANPSAENPALFPAANYLVSQGDDAAQLAPRLSAALAGAAPRLQARLAEWLTANGRAEDALLLITPAKASRDPDAYMARAATLEQLGRWDDLLAMSEAASPLPDSLRLAWRTLAASKSDKKGVASQSLAESLRAAAREGQLGMALTLAERAGQRGAADEILVAMCADPAVAEEVFAGVRNRFSHSGRHQSLDRAFQAAKASVPSSWVVQDYERRSQLLAGETIDPTSTAAAVQEQPSNETLRFTHALALLRAGRAEDALGVFHDIDILVSSLPPSDQAIVVAIFEANGMTDHAARTRSLFDADMLQPGEYRLVLPTAN